MISHCSGPKHHLDGVSDQSNRPRILRYLRHREPRGPERKGEHKGEAGGCRTPLASMIRVVQGESREATGEEHGNTHHNGSPVQGHSPTEAVEGENGDQC